MVPIDMLPSFIKKLMSASSNLLDSERETVENLVSHATLISSEAKDVLLKKEKDLAAGSLNKVNEDASLLPSSVTTTGIDKFSHFEFAGKSSYSSKDTQSEEHKHESGTTSELGMKSSSGQIEDKLSPPQSADNGQEKRDKEPVGTLKVTDKGNDSKGPSKKRTKTYIKEKPLTDWCSRNKNHEKAIIEFSECSHRLCGYCVKSITCNNSPTVYCGTMIGKHRTTLSDQSAIEGSEQVLERSRYK
ncbi:uncharacterized protein [Argopecten irradians]|uniref:uncharacterized protein n=1 Tax=Argopecten irradians TaxID=31199 RepID=UPI00371F3FCF